MRDFSHGHQPQGTHQRNIEKRAERGADTKEVWMIEEVQIGKKFG